MTMTQSPIVLALGALVLFIVGRSILHGVVEERKIRQLGGHAPRIQTWIPWGLGILADIVQKATKHKTLDFWQTSLSKNGNCARPWTTEAMTVGRRIVFTADEDNIKAMLATQFNDYGKGPRFHEEWHDFLGDSIFVTDGTLWHDSRQLIRPQFIKDRVSDLHIFERHIGELIPLLGGDGKGSTINAMNIFYQYTLDAATDFLLGRSVGSMGNQDNTFANAFGEVQRVQGLIAISGPLNRFVPRKTFYQSLKVMEAFIQPFIEQALSLSPEELEKKSKSDEGYTFLHALAGFTRDPKILRDQLVAVLLAGRDTTALTLSWMFYELSRRPEIVSKLREEIQRHVGLERKPTYADLKSMRYLQHTINETLRLYPIVPYNVRIALKDTSLPRGGGPDGMDPIGILQGTPVAYSTIVLQRRADIYPPPSERFPHHLEFAPERWDSWTPKTWTYIPFNGGPRICIGQQFALTETGYTAARILQTYSRIENAMTEAPKLKADIALQPSDGVEISFHK